LRLVEGGERRGERHRDAVPDADPRRAGQPDAGDEQGQQAEQPRRVRQGAVEVGQEADVQHDQRDGRADEGLPAAGAGPGEEQPAHEEPEDRAVEEPEDAQVEVAPADGVPVQPAHRVDHVRPVGVGAVEGDDVALRRAVRRDVVPLRAAEGGVLGGAQPQLAHQPAAVTVVGQTHRPVEEQLRERRGGDRHGHQRGLAPEAVGEEAEEDREARNAVYPTGRAVPAGRWPSRRNGWPLHPRGHDQNRKG
jgi:hypothetical protein